MGDQRAHIVRTDGLVLRGVDYGETSRIVTLYTRSHGRIGVMARGARGKNSRYGSTLQPMAYIQAVMHVKPNRDLQSLSETAHLRRFARLGEDLERMKVGLRVVELISSLTQDHEASPEILNLAIDTLTAIDEVPERAENAWPYFALKMGAFLGFAPSFTKADVAAIEDPGGWLELDSGHISSNRGNGPAGVRASRAALRAFAISSRAALDDVLRMRQTVIERAELQSLVEQYLRYHVEEAYPERAQRVFAQLVGGESLRR